ncbi:hypothetical protein DMX08_28960 [Pseudomonas protegens]|uniref:Uncharacterized protein n=1 Tax=Pseudomonas protegens TaxID=380021 RepID=A0A9Q6IBN4_9PSED|nr:hypothetical protein DMX08_28960 [Pseudomonas protegens]
MGRRHRPSLAGWRLTRRPAGLPTAQCLRSAIVVNGALRIKSQGKAEREPWLCLGLLLRQLQRLLFRHVQHMDIRTTKPDRGLPRRNGI